MANTLFPSYQRQASFNLGSGSNGSVPFISIPGVSLQEADKGSYVLWSHDAQDDPYKLINCAQNHFKNRKPSEVSDDAETELQGLVSNILDEADSQDSLYSDGSLGEGSNNIWSPKNLQDELLLYFQAEANAQYKFSPNCISHDAFGKTQGQTVNKETEELSNGFKNNQQMLFELPNGIQNFSQRRKSPPGLAIPPNMANTYLQLQQNNYENRPVPKDRENGENLGNFPDFSHVFKPQDNMNGGELLYNEHYNQAMDEPAIANEQYTSQDLNQLVSSFQSFVTGEHDSTEFGTVPTMIQRDEKWPSPTCFMEFDRSPQVQRQLASDFVHCNGTRKQLFKRDSLQDLSSHSLQNTDYSPQQILSMRNNTNIIHRDNSSRNFALNHYPQVQQSPLKFKPQMQSEKKRTSGFFTNSFNLQSPNGEIFLNEKQPAFYNFRSPRFNSENSSISPQYSPIMYAHDPRRCPTPIPNPNFSPRGSLVYRGNMDVAEVTSEMSRFSPGLNGRRMESTFHGMPPSPGNRGGPVLQLYYYLDECYEQWRSLEKERKRTEIVLSKIFLGKRTSALPTSSLPKTPPNPSRVDHLIVNQMREQARVSSLLDKMECLSSVALNPNIYNTLTKHHMAICVTSARRKEEILGMSQNQHQRGHFTDDRDSMMLVLALKDLTVSTRKLRTAVWCALQTSLPQPRPETPVPEAPRDQTSPALCEGYSYRI
ncbi:unnamed protein product [Knipowitschia caucasica]